MKYSFLIVCLFVVACHTPRQVISPTVETAKPVFFEKDEPVTVPELVEEAVMVFPPEPDAPVFVDLENSSVLIETLPPEPDGPPNAPKRKKVTVTQKEREIIVHRVDSVQLITIRYPGFDSIFVVSGKDTMFSHVLKNEFKVNCPPTLPAMPTDGAFPWSLVLFALGGLLVWWVVKRKVKKKPT